MQGSNGNQTYALLAQFLEQRIKAIRPDGGTDSFSRCVRFEDLVDNSRQGTRALPYHFRLLRRGRAEIVNHTYSAELALVNHGYAVTKRFGIGENMSGKENS